MALGIGYGLPFISQHGTNPYKTQWAAAREGAKGAGATVEDENAGAGSCLVSRGQDVYTDGLPFTPSLLIVPQFYKAGNLYQDVPPFVAEDSTMRFTVSRNTTATRVNASGLIESVASGVPRIDWLGQSCPALLVEASGQNLVPSGLVFNAAAGVLYDTAVSDSPAVGINSARITKNEASGNIQYASQTCSTSALSGSTTYTISRFFKYDGVDFATSMEYNNVAQWGGTSWNQLINIASSGVTLGTSTSCTGSVENYGNGWYRVAVRITTGASPSGSPVTYLMRLPAALSTGQGFLTALPQLETGSVATTYIPTTSGAVSRAAEAISASGALVSGLIGQTAGTIYCEFAYFGQPVTRSGPIYLRQGSLRGMGINFAPTDSPSGIRFSSRNNAGTTNINIVSGALQIGTFYKVAIAYDAAGTAAGGTQASGVVAYVNGVQTNIGTLQVPDAAGLTEFRMYGANSGDDNEAFNGRIRAAALYTTRLTDAQLAELTRL